MKEFKELQRKDWYNILSILDSEYKKAEDTFSVNLIDGKYTAKSNRCDCSYNWYFDTKKNKIYYYDYDEGILKETKSYYNLEIMGIYLKIDKL